MKIGNVVRPLYNKLPFNNLFLRTITFIIFHAFIQLNKFLYKKKLFLFTMQLFIKWKFHHIVYSNKIQVIKQSGRNFHFINNFLTD